jgi:DNA-binding CsgD family transcriptional regulator
MGITYGTARGYLKLIFQKTGVRTQSQLVALLLGGSTSGAG